MNALDWIKTKVEVIKEENKVIKEKFQEANNELKQAQLKNCIVKQPGIVLKKDEICYYKGKAYSYHERQAVVGRKSIVSGVSFKVMKGVRVHTAGSSSQSIRGAVSEKYEGVFLLTNQRVILLAQKYGFDIQLQNLTSVGMAKDAFIFFHDGKSDTVITSDMAKLSKIMGLIEIPSSN